MQTNAVVVIYSRSSIFADGNDEISVPAQHIIYFEAKCKYTLGSLQTHTVLQQHNTENVARFRGTMSQ